MPKHENCCIFLISNRPNNSFIFQILKVVGPLRGNFDFFSLSGFEIESGFDCKTSNIKLHSVRVLKCYMNDNNLILGQETVTISKFSALIFETYFEARPHDTISCTQLLSDSLIRKLSHWFQHNSTKESPDTNCNL